MIEVRAVPQKRHSFTLVELLTILAFAVILFAMIYPAFHSTRIVSCGRYRCTSNLKQIGLALFQYSADYEGEIPPENDAAGLNYLLQTEMLTDYRVYLCPNTSGEPQVSGEPITELHCGYLFFGGGRLGPDGLQADSIVSMDKPGNHKHFQNTLHAGGHVNRNEAGDK